MAAKIPKPHLYFVGETEKNVKKIPGKCMQLHSDTIISTIKNVIITVIRAGFLGCDL